MDRLPLFSIPLAMVATLASIVSAISFSFRPSGMLKTELTTQDTVKIVLDKTQFKDMVVLYITDTAQSTETISGVLGKGYGELMQYIQQNKLQPKKFMAWYYSTQSPWQMDIAVEINKIPAEFSGRIKSRMQPGGDVLIAHIWGPYDQVGRAYMQIENWLRENNRKAKGNSFEVYVNDPSAVKSPAEIQTDVYQPLQ